MVGKEELVKIAREQGISYADATDGIFLNQFDGWNEEIIVDDAIEGFLIYLRDEFGEKWLDEVEDELIDELIKEFKESFKKRLKERAIEIAGSYFNEGYKTVALVLGVQHIHTPYKYYPKFKVLSNRRLDKKGVQAVLEDRGVEPHAWGVVANTNSWGNYWWIVLNPANYQEEINNLNVALAVLADYPELFLDD